MNAADLAGYAAFKAENARLALEGSSRTRWGSAHPQMPGMAFTVELKTPRLLRGLRYDLDEWRHDYLRALQIELEPASGEKQMLLSPDRYEAVLYYGRVGAELMFVFDPVLAKRVVLSQLGSHVLLNWSIAEIKLFE